MPTRSPRSYGSFCPVAQASEVLAQRWVPLILREIMVGYHRFNEMRRALPHISPSVLTQRLKALEEDGVILRRTDGLGVSYHLSGAGEELAPVVMAMGHWAEKWLMREYRPDQLDPGVMMWALRRHVRPARFPAGRTVLHVHLDGEPRACRYWWLVVQPGHVPEVDVCRADPGHPVTLTILGPLRSWVDLLVNRVALPGLMSERRLVLEGKHEAQRGFERFFDFGPGTGIIPASIPR